MPSGLEIQQALRAFARRWRSYDGSERGEAQTFLKDLTTLHTRLDEAVVACYGWPSRVAQDEAELVRRLLAHNAAIAGGDQPHRPFGTRGPGS